ncbi:MAG: sodium:solute symporter [Prevotella sp.]|nr:sodium:solute symporter [Prevotella sp.]
MNAAAVVLTTVIIYLLILFSISRWTTSRHSTNDTFFRGNRRSPWALVAFGMIGASVSGVTFVSVPGMVLTSSMTYLQVCIGFILGYIAVAFILLPVYYQLNLTTIYTYLGHRFGQSSYKTGSTFFLFSKLVGASVKFYVVCIILQQFVLSALGVPFPVTVAAMVLLIWIYTRRGGIGTLVFTDTFQTICLFAALLLIIWQAIDTMGLSLNEAIDKIASDERSQVFVWDNWKSPRYFWKQLLSGAFIVIVMTGLDQDMMQKNLTCRTLKDAQKNMCTYGVAFLPANLLFLALGILLAQWYTGVYGVSTLPEGDQLLPAFVAQQGLPVLLLFTIGIMAASFSSADSALTSLTTSFCVDICQDSDNEKLRKQVHLSICLLFALVILTIHALNNQSLIDTIYLIVSYTYGPLLGLFAFGLFTKKPVTDRLVPYICLLSPFLCYAIDWLCQRQFNYHFGYELLMLNGLLTFLGLWLIRGKRSENKINER